MAGLVDKQTVIEAVHKEFDERLVWDESGEATANEFERIINEVPSIRPEKAKWIWKTGSRYECSECGMQTEVDEVMQEPIYSVCPFCGANMCDDDGNVKWTRYL